MPTQPDAQTTVEAKRITNIRTRDSRCAFIGAVLSFSQVPFFLPRVAALEGVAGRRRVGIHWVGHNWRVGSTKGQWPNLEKPVPMDSRNGQFLVGANFQKKMQGRASAHPRKRFASLLRYLACPRSAPFHRGRRAIAQTRAKKYKQEKGKTAVRKMERRACGNGAVELEMSYEGLASQARTT